MTAIFINEFHYDNASADEGEFIEIAGPAGTDLTGWNLVLYNGNNSLMYATLQLSGVLGDEGQGYGTVAVPATGIQNGSPDGIALVDAAGAVVQFLSYEGVMTALDGPANGMTSTDIGVAEGGETGVGMSVSLTGTGSEAGDFTWTGPADDTPGETNTGQTFVSGPVATTYAIGDAQQPEGDAGTSVMTFSVTRSDGSGAASLNWTTTDGTAIAGSDYVAASGTVDFADGQTEATIGITINGDTLPELPETFSVTLSDPTGTLSITQAVAQGTIGNDEVTLISTIQGSPETQGANPVNGYDNNDASPLSGQVVTIDAIVVGDFQDGDGDEGRSLGGFYLQEQDSDSDGNALTSEGIFVFDGSFGTDVQVGDRVRVTGTVGEYFAQTQISGVTEIEVLSQGNALPTAAVVELGNGVSTDQTGAYQADLEAYEGMLVTVPRTLTITEQFQLGRFNEITLFDTNGFEQAGPAGTTITGERPFTYTQFNTPDADGLDAYMAQVASRQITYDDGLNLQNQSIGNLDGFQGYSTATAPSMGDTVTGLTGVMDHQWAGNAVSGATWRIRSTQDGQNTFEDTNPRPDAIAEVAGNIKVASFNVLNFFTSIDVSGNEGVGPDLDQQGRGADSVEEYNRQLDKLTTAIEGMGAHVIGLVELENDFVDPGIAPGNTGAQGDRGLPVAAIVASLNENAGADIWSWVDPGSEFVGDDAIAGGMIYRTDMVQIASGTQAAFLTDAQVDPALLAQSSTGSIFNGSSTSRASLATTFETLSGGDLMTVVVNHFKSKGGSGTGEDADAGDGAGNFNNQRLLAAQALDDWLETNPTGSDTPNMLLLGDLNSYASEDPLSYLIDTAGFVDVAAEFVELGYSYLFDAMLGGLDYALASVELFNYIVDAIEWNINSDEADALDYNLDFGRDPSIFDGDTPYRASDHDPVVVGIDFDRDNGPVTPVSDRFTLELLHFSDQEGSTSALADAPNLSAVLNALRGQDVGGDGVADNTLTLSSGDAFIGSPFYDASGAVFGSKGIADIQIQNELGVQAMSLGNHEFDFGTANLAGLISGDAPGNILGSDFQGALFPYLSTNLDFATDPNLAPLEVAGGQAPQARTVTSSVVMTMDSAQTGQTELVGIVGATTPTLARISSTGSLGITPDPFDNDPTPQQLDALAAQIQSEVDALLAANPDMNKIILLAHMQVIGIEEQLATRLSGVDVIVAGGSNTRLFDEDDRPRDGDSDQGQYPIFTTDADGNPVAVVNTDGGYKYVGRLVVDFDEDGHIIPESYDQSVSGAYATDAQGVAELGAQDMVDPEIQQIIDDLEAEILSTQSNIFGYSDVFLNGNRTGTQAGDDTDGVRTQETNLGNLTAMANLEYAKDYDNSVMISIKNGGGIRASIGETVVPAGATAPVRLPNGQLVDSDGNIIKPEGAISQNDIASALAFNNGLSLVSMSTTELLEILEHASASSGGGAFGQFAGISFSFDPDLPAGDRVTQADIVDENGASVLALVRNGDVVADPDLTIRAVTLGFLIPNGDGYPFDLANPDRVDLFDLDGDMQADGLRDGIADFADNGTEQDAFAEYLANNHGTRATAYDQVDTGRDEDMGITNLGFADQTVRLDMAGTADWSQITQNFDGNGTLRERIVDGDNGDITTIRYDSSGNKLTVTVADTADQSPRMTTTDIFGTDGSLSRREVLLDDGRTKISIYENGQQVAEQIEETDGSSITRSYEGQVLEQTRWIAANGDQNVRGEGGNDVIFGGSGDDKLTGGAGDDTFVFFEAGFGQDRIADFDLAGNDLLDLSAFGIQSLSDLQAVGTLQQEGRDVVIDLGADSITLSNNLLGDLGDQDFFVLNLG